MQPRRPKKSEKSHEDFKTWVDRAKHLNTRRDQAEIRECYRQAYFNSSDLSESLWNFSLKVVGRELDGLEPDKRREFATFCADPHPRKMLQAARGSWKSSLSVVDHACWLIGREMVVNRDESRIRILMASETEQLAMRNLRAVRQIMEWREPYIQLVGQHRPDKDVQMWSRGQLTSRFRLDPTIMEPTVSPMGLDSARAGFHFDVIFMDDLEADRSSATPDLIENCWEFYRLLLSILAPGGMLFISCTRWHPDDIYQRIENQNPSLKEDRKIKILRIPADDGEGHEIGNLNFPSVLTREELETFRDTQRRRIFNAQYRLKVTEDEEQTFKKDWLRYISLTDLMRKKLNIYVSCDFAWTEKGRYSFRREKKSDYTVIETWAIDENYHYHCLDWFRDRCSKRKAVEEIYRQYFEHKAFMAICQRYDRSQIGDTIEQYGFEFGKFVNVEWVSYPAEAGKDDRIESICEPAFRSGKIHLQRDMQWFIDEEYDPFPHGRKDGFDCICNVVHVATPSSKVEAKVKETENSRRIKQLKAGTFDPDAGKREESWRDI